MSMRPSLLLLLCILLLGETSTVKWHRLDNLEYYFANKAKRDYNAALAACKEMGASLAKFNSQRIHEVLTKFTVRRKGFYIGLKRVEPTDEFQWLDGTKLTWTNWNYGSPHYSDRRRSRDCVIVRRRSKMILRWVDFPCTVPLGYICQRFVGKARIEASDSANKTTFSRTTTVERALTHSTINLSAFVVSSTLATPTTIHQMSTIRTIHTPAESTTSVTKTNSATKVDTVGTPSTNNEAPTTKRATQTPPDSSSVATTSYPYFIPPQAGHILQQQPSATTTLLSSTKDRPTEMSNSQAQESNDPITIVISTMFGGIILLCVVVFLICKRPPKKTYADTANELARGRALYPNLVFMSARKSRVHAEDGENGYVGPNPVFPSKRRGETEHRCYEYDITNIRSPEKSPEITNELSSKGTVNDNQVDMNIKVHEEEEDEDRYGYVTANPAFPVQPYGVTNEYVEFNPGEMVDL